MPNTSPHGFNFQERADKERQEALAATQHLMKEKGELDAAKAKLEKEMAELKAAEDNLHKEKEQWLAAQAREKREREDWERAAAEVMLACMYHCCSLLKMQSCILLGFLLGLKKWCCAGCALGFGAPWLSGVVAAWLSLLAVVFIAEREERRRAVPGKGAQCA